MMTLVVLSAVAGVIAFVSAILYRRSVLKVKVEDEEMMRISSYIREGAMAFLKREYRTIAYLSLIVILLIMIGLSYEGLDFVIYTAIAFVVGAFLSLLAGWIGMDTATSSNARTAFVAKEKGLLEAFKLAYRGGTVMGLGVASLALLGMTVLFLIFYKLTGDIKLSANVIAGFSVGAAFVALFARVGGGIYTKAADVGADLVGKVEAGIPEDDPRNPAVIADNVGDNVGDTAGMGADLYDSYVAGTVAAVVISALHENSELAIKGIAYAFALGALGTLASIFGYFFIPLFRNLSPQRILMNTVFAVGVLFALSSLALTYWIYGNLLLYLPLMFGLVSGILIGYIAEFFSTGKRIEHLAKASQSGVAVNIIEGIALGMRSSVVPAIAVSLSFVIAYKMGELSPYGGFYGVAIACIGMLAISGITVAVDAFGPIADNAGGIVEMTGHSEVRKITDELDAAGNTTAAIGKGFAIGSAIFTVMAVFSAYSDVVKEKFIHDFLPTLLQPEVVAAALIGAIVPFYFSSQAMTAVGRTAQLVVEEVRRQWREIKGIMEGKAKPDYAKVVDITTAGAIRNMAKPGMVAFVSPLLVGSLFGLEALGGFLVGAMVSGIPLALMMNNAGAAWDNAKKYVEQTGAFGGKGSPVHKATVEGDTVGDPFKDTAGPSLNILLKMMSIVSLVFIPLMYFLYQNVFSKIFGF